MHKLPDGKYMASRKNAKDDLTGVNDSLLRGQDFFLCLLVRLLIPPKRSVDFKAPCQKSSRSLMIDGDKKVVSKQPFASFLKVNSLQS